MGQSQSLSADAADTVIIALIIDYWGIVKADVGIKNGRIWKVGKAGNPDTSGVGIVIGPRTEAIAGGTHFDCRRDRRSPPFFALNRSKKVWCRVSTMLAEEPVQQQAQMPLRLAGHGTYLVLQSADDFSMNLGFRGRVMRAYRAL